MAQQTARTESGVLVIGFTPSAEIKVFPRILPLLRVRFPQAQFLLQSMTNPGLCDALWDKQIDIGFLRKTELGENFEVQSVLQDRFVAVLPEDHPLAQQSIVRIEQLGKHPFIDISKHDAPELRLTIQNFVDARGVKLQTVQNGGNVLTTLNLVAMGLGISVLPDYGDAFEVKGLTSRPIEGEPSIELHVAWRKGNHSSVLASFLGLLRSVMMEPKVNLSPACNRPQV